MLPFWGVGKVYAQNFNVVTRNVNVSASVLDRIEMINIRDVMLSNQKAIDGFVEISPISSTYAGMLRITGSPNRLVRITYVTQEVLVEEGGNGGFIEALYTLSGYETENQNASRLLENGEAVIQLGPNGTYFIWLGAKLDLNKAKPGSYASDFLIEMDGN